MNVDDRIRLIKRKLDRAIQHVQEMEAALAAFIQSDPYQFGCDANSCFFTKVTEVPAPISSIAGDAIHNIRSALDHLAQQLFLVANPNATTAKFVYFPTFSDAQAYRTEAPRKVHGIAPAARAAIDALEPYKGGKGEMFWVLNKLDNIDKHRALVTCGGAFGSMNLIPSLVTMMGSPHDKFLEGRELFFKMKDRMCPLKVGDVFFTGPIRDDLKKNVKPTVEICIHEPGVLETANLGETVMKFGKLVDATVNDFRVHLQ